MKTIVTVLAVIALALVSFTTPATATVERAGSAVTWQANEQAWNSWDTQEIAKDFQVGSRISYITTTTQEPSQELATQYGQDLNTTIYIIHDSTDTNTSHVFSVEFEEVGLYQPCATEDSQSCIWVATDRGNGVGTSYLSGDEEGEYYTLPHHIAKALVTK